MKCDFAGFLNLPIYVMPITHYDFCLPWQSINFFYMVWPWLRTSFHSQKTCHDDDLHSGFYLHTSAFCSAHGSSKSLQNFIVLFDCITALQASYSSKQDVPWSISSKYVTNWTIDAAGIDGMRDACHILGLLYCSKHLLTVISWIGTIAKRKCYWCMSLCSFRSCMFWYIIILFGPLSSTLERRTKFMLL